MPSRGVGQPSLIEDVDLTVDALPSYAEVDVPPDLGFDVVPDTVFDVTAEAVLDVRPRRKGQPRTKPGATERVPPSMPSEALRTMSVCLLCGQSPPTLGDCPHEEIAHLTAAGSVLAAAAHKLFEATVAQRAQARALRRMVGLEVAAGRGDIEVARPAPRATKPHDEQHGSGSTASVPCTAGTTRRAPPRRRPPSSEVQGTFPFLQDRAVRGQE